ncbi:TPA: hypothetical protein N0F65_000752 [Lagenidium giganteum]|uniref:Uncharacterized protein n=1 Tax=Lagenidium giganteum TaxID=4803 RepID=A0AAV2ZHQ7_9STRA|nr:TPA: hypothetical protein N0F65_000752 [Lagenidium giganteum]
MPKQHAIPQPAALKFPALTKAHRPTRLKEQCNQEEEDVQGGSTHPSANETDDSIDEDERPQGSRNNSSRALPTSASASATNPRASDKNRDFIRELEEKKRKQKEDQARKERRKQKLQAKLSRKILNEAAQARQKQQQQQPEADGQELQNGEAERDDDEEGADDADIEEDEAELRRRKEKVKQQKKLLKRQQAHLESLLEKKREKQLEIEMEKERERRVQEKVRRTILDAIQDANNRMDPEEDDDEDVAQQVDEAAQIETEPQGKRRPDDAPSTTLLPPKPSPPASLAAGSAVAALRQRRESNNTAAVSSGSTTEASASPPVEEKPRTKEPRETIHKKQQEYLTRLADQRKQKLKEEEDNKLLQEKRRKRAQQEAMQRLQEAARQQQLQNAQKEKEEPPPVEKPPVVVDVDAMIARLSKLKEKDAQVIPEARDFLSWKKRHGVRSDQKVFCMTGWYPVIREELEKRGWFFNQERMSPFFDLKWSLKSDDLKGIKLEKDQYVNHFFQNTAITTKVGLLHNLRSIVWHQSVDVDTLFPRAYDLNEPRDMEMFVQDFRYVYAEGLLKKLARTLLQQRKQGSSAASAGKINRAFTDVLAAIAVKRLKWKRTGSAAQLEALASRDDVLDDSVDSPLTIGVEELVTDLQWEVLTKCQIDAPGKLRASLAYRKKTYVEDTKDALLAGGDGSTGVNGGAAPMVDTVLTALDKKQQRQLEKQRSEAFAREKSRLNELLGVVAPVDEDTGEELVRLVLALEKECPQFRLNGGGDVHDGAGSKSGNVWIVKPAGMSRGRGIRVFNQLDQLLEYADVENHKECQWVAQKYIENPLLICRRKFDIRQWVLVTCWDPLTVWFYQDCYLRFSSEEYQMDDLTDQYVHLTNNSIQKYSEKFNDVYTTDDGEMRVEGNMWHSDELQHYLRTKLGRDADVWPSHVQQRMKDIVVASLQCVQDQVQHRPNSCELYGYDFMLDETLTPWLIEVNSSPACDYSTPTAKRYVETGLAGIIKVIVDHREYETKRKTGALGAGTPEPDTGCWLRIHRAEYIGKPVSSFGADFQVRGTKIQRTRRGGRSSSSTTATAKKDSRAVQPEVAATIDEEHEGDQESDADDADAPLEPANDGDGDEEISSSADDGDAKDGRKEREEEQEEDDANSVDSLL